jgi:hypothetical protein
LNVDPVEQRTGYFRAVALYLQRRAGTFFLGIGKKATRTGVHGGNQHKTRGVLDRSNRARHSDVAVF